MENQLDNLPSRVAAIRARMKAAAAGRPDAERIILLAAVKYATAEQIDTLVDRCGVTDIGENRVQQLLDHYDKITCRDRVNIHFIGSLQRNKVKYIIDKVTMIHSLDSLPLAAEIERQCVRVGRTMDVLVEINSGEEESKGGILPADVPAFCRELDAFPHLKLRGFMTMAPKCADLAQYRKYFSQTFGQCLDIWQKKYHNIGSMENSTPDAPIISMGMSDSFEAAIAEGSTLVRIGGALFR